MPQKPPDPKLTDQWLLVNQHFVMSNHLNGSGQLFGGIMLQWLDEAAAMFAQDVAEFDKVVTISVTEVVFKTPGKLGTRVRMYGRPLRFGRSSLTLEMRASAYDASIGYHVDMTTCQFTFVCIDDFGRPYPRFELKPELRSAWLADAPPRN